MRRLVTMLGMLLATLILTACSAAPADSVQVDVSNRQTATFLRYEDTTPIKLLTPEEIERREEAGEPRIQFNPDDGKTGYAFVQLASGTEIRANCPIQNLAQGQRVTVQANDDGTWTVVQ